MEERGLLFSGFTILWKFLSFGIAIALLLLYEKSFRSVVYTLALAEILSGTIAAFAALWNISAKKTGLDREAISTMLRYAIPLLPATIISWIYTSSDQYMLRIISGYTELGLYTAAHKIIAIISILQNSFTALWAPVGLRWYESRKDPVYFDLVMWAIGFVSTVLGLGLLLCKNLVALVLGSGFRMALTIFPFLLLSPILYTVSETSFVGISFSRKTGYNSVISGATAIVNVILNLILIPIWGGRGAAIATGLSYILFFWLRTLISRKLWRSFPLGHFIVNSLILAANCFVHTFLSGSAPYLISAVSIAVLTAVAVPTIKKTWTLLRKLDA